VRGRSRSSMTGLPPVNSGLRARTAQAASAFGRATSAAPAYARRGRSTPAAAIRGRRHSAVRAARPETVRIDLLRGCGGAGSARSRTARKRGFRGAGARARRLEIRCAPPRRGDRKSPVDRAIETTIPGDIASAVAVLWCSVPVGERSRLALCSGRGSRQGRRSCRSASATSVERRGPMVVAQTLESPPRREWFRSYRCALGRRRGVPLGAAASRLARAGSKPRAAGCSAGSRRRASKTNLIVDAAKLP
jgi:hypothetical protein